MIHLSTPTEANLIDFNLFHFIESHSMRMQMCTNYVSLPWRTVQNWEAILTTIIVSATFEKSGSVARRHSFAVRTAIFNVTRSLIINSKFSRCKNINEASLIRKTCAGISNEYNIPTWTCYSSTGDWKFHGRFFRDRRERWIGDKLNCEWPSGKICFASTRSAQ